jgi:hypothetical protein
MAATVIVGFGYCAAAIVPMQGCECVLITSGGQCTEAPKTESTPKFSRSDAIEGRRENSVAEKLKSQSAEFRIPPAEAGGCFTPDLFSGGGRQGLNNPPASAGGIWKQAALVGRA